MSWFYGHLFPGTCWWIFGLFLWIQSLHKLGWTNKFRTQPKWIAFRSGGVMIAAFLGSLGEVIVPILDKNSVNVGHIVVWLGFSLSAACELLHLYKVLPEPVWSLFSAAGLSFVSLMFQFHDQPRWYWTYLHVATGYATIPIVVIVAAMAIRGTKIATKLSKKNKSVESPSTGLFFWRGRTFEDLNPVYTDQTVYDTALPGALAFFLMLQGCLWFEMLYEMGWYTMDNLPPELHPDGHHAPHRMLETLIRDIIICIGAMLVSSLVAKQIEASSKRNNSASLD